MNGKALTGELLDVYDIDGRRTGRTIERKNCFDNIDYESERLLLVHACIFNSRGQMLLQRRQLTKDRYPGLWDVSAGGFRFLRGRTRRRGEKRAPRRARS